MCPLSELTSKEREKSSSISVAVPKMESAEQKSSMGSVSSLGNQAMLNRMQSCASFPQSCPTGGACHICPKSSPSVQPKLKINKPGDKYEQEADRVADQVMRMPESQSLAGGIQRACSSCKEDEELLQRQPLEEEVEEDEEEIMLKPDREGAETNVSTGAAVENLASLGESGKSLSEVDNSFFSQRFGYDFGGVRVHTGSTASKDSQSINARAFTYGNHIVFGQGQYHPGSESGKKLLAHELTHVIQQGSSDNVSRKSILPFSINSVKRKEQSIQRWSYGTGASPHADFVVVPANQRPRVNRALRIIGRIANNRPRYRRCHNRFQTLCTSHAAGELLTRFNSAVVWRTTDSSEYGSSVAPDNISYGQETYRWGAWMLASTLLHEMMHNCGYDNERGIARTERLCGLPESP